MKNSTSSSSTVNSQLPLQNLWIIHIGHCIMMLIDNDS